MSQDDKHGGPCKNTDRELWRELPGDYYANSIHVTEGGGIGINCGGHVFVKTLREWHKFALRAEQATPSAERAQEPGAPIPEVVDWRGMQASAGFKRVLADVLPLGDALADALVKETARRRRAEILLVATQQAYVREHEAPSAPSATSAHKVCPYCTSDNEAIRSTYYDQTCEGCVKRMGRP